MVNLLLTMKSKKIIAKILFFISTLIAVPCFGQLKYSIDIEPAKNRQIDLSYRMTTIKETIKTNHQIRVKHRVDRRESRKTWKHTCRIQTKKVRKHMKRERRDADFFYRDKDLLSVSIHKLFHHE